MIDVDQGVKAGAVLVAVAVLSVLVYLIWRAARYHSAHLLKAGSAECPPDPESG